MNLKKYLIAKAQKAQKRIVFPEAEFSDRVVEAIKIIAKKRVATPVAVGNKSTLLLKFEGLKGVQIVEPSTFENKDQIAEHIFNKRKAKGVSLQEAQKLALDPIYFACIYVDLGYADGIVCGAEVSTAKTLKPALQIIKGKKGLVSSYFLFGGKNRVTDDIFMMGDCAVIEQPNAEQLSQIACLMLEQNKKLGLFEPRFAFLSYSTMGSADSESVQKVRQAHQLFVDDNPNVYALGEVQFDASILPNVAKTKMPNINFKAPANMFVMPNIDAGNICYKAVQYFGGLTAIGPVTMGFNKPVNDLSRGCTVDEIVLTCAITAIQCD